MGGSYPSAEVHSVYSGQIIIFSKTIDSIVLNTNILREQSAGAVEYTDCFSAEG